jgi:hypothetical protein
MNRPQFQIVEEGRLFRLWSKPSKDRMWVVSHPVDQNGLARLIDRRLDLYRKAGAR